MPSDLGAAEPITDVGYPTIGLAVRAHVTEHGIDRRDWEDRRGTR